MKTGNGDTWQPMTGADPARIKALGALLRQHRADLGYRHVPQFVRARDINTRMVGDLEHGRRDTFTYPSLTNAARAYEVTYDSMMAVVWSGAGELIPAPAGVAASATLTNVPDDWRPPIADPARRDAAAPYAVKIMERLLDLADAGVIDPSGAQVFPGAPDDAQAWDGIGRRMDVRDRAWFIADLRRWAARGGNSGTGEAGALGSRLHGMMVRV